MMMINLITNENMAMPHLIRRIVVTMICFVNKDIMMIIHLVKRNTIIMTHFLIKIL